MSTPDERRKIRQLNAQLARRGATSRYVDDAPQEDFTFDGEEHGVSTRDAPDEVPEHLRLRANKMEEETLEELKRRGIDRSKRNRQVAQRTIEVGPRVDPKDQLVRRAQNVSKMLGHQRVQGYGYEKYETELADLQLEMKDWKEPPACHVCGGRQMLGPTEQYYVHVHYDDAVKCCAMQDHAELMDLDDQQQAVESMGSAGEA